MNNKEKLAHFLGIDEKLFDLPEISQADRIEAQALYTALMTDTLLEEDYDA